MIKASEVRKGQVITYENALFTVIDIERVSKGNWRSYLQAKLRNVKTGQTVDQRLGVDDRIEVAFVETKPFEFLYRDGTDFVVMDKATFDQIHVSAEIMGEANLYLKGNEQVLVSFIDGNPVGVELPNTVELVVTDAPPVVKGATATNQSKEALMETGLRVRVPPFINIGETLRIDTRTGEYLERA